MCALGLGLQSIEPLNHYDLHSPLECRTVWLGPVGERFCLLVTSKRLWVCVILSLILCRRSWVRVILRTQWTLCLLDPFYINRGLSDVLNVLNSSHLVCSFMSDFQPYTTVMSLSDPFWIYRRRLDIKVRRNRSTWIVFKNKKCKKKKIYLKIR